jgi:hypothetical protein
MYMIDVFKDPIFTKGKIINNEHEEKFHHEVLEQTGLDIKRTFFEYHIIPELKELGFNGEYISMQLTLLGKNNEKWKLHKTLPEDDPTAKTVWELFYKYLYPQYLDETLKARYNELPKKSSLYLMSLDLWMPRETIDKTIFKVNRAIHFLFPAQKKVVYNWTDKNNVQTHFFIYKEKSGLQKDIESGNTERMRKIAFRILKRKDYLNYFSFENYHPVFTSVQDLTSDEVFGITRENFDTLPWVGYQGY